jgi:hypothetical protein
MMKRVQEKYEKDFYAWAIHNAKLLREGKLTEVDIEHVAEEIECMGKSERREMVNRLAILLVHLLKWKYQPARQSRSWQLTIKEQRLQLANLLKDSPSLKNELESKIEEAYEQAIIIAERETALEKTFPKKCPFIMKQILTQTYFPNDKEHKL